MVIIIIIIKVVIIASSNRCSKNNELSLRDSDPHPHDARVERVRSGP